LPKNLYNIQWKFRDERRPRFGVMRGREFLMKDAYSFDVDEAGARRSYNRMFLAYLNVYARLGLKAVPVKADPGPIGGDLSHEFMILADTGESQVFAAPRPGGDGRARARRGLGRRPGARGRRRTSLYAASDEMHDEARFAAMPGRQADDRPRHRGGATSSISAPSTPRR
jgi:prolyl-tRNA synthetase